MLLIKKQMSERILQTQTKKHKIQRTVALKHLHRGEGVGKGQISRLRPHPADTQQPAHPAVNGSVPSGCQVQIQNSNKYPGQHQQAASSHAATAAPTCTLLATNRQAAGGRQPRRAPHIASCSDIRCTPTLKGWRVGWHRCRPGARAAPGRRVSRRCGHGRGPPRWACPTEPR